MKSKIDVIEITFIFSTKWNTLKFCENNKYKIIKKMCDPFNIHSYDAKLVFEDASILDGNWIKPNKLNCINWINIDFCKFIWKYNS